MTGEGIFLTRGGELAVLTEQPYATENVLQRALAEHPEVIAGPTTSDCKPGNLLLVRREMGVPDAGGSTVWSLDHLFLDAEGVPTGQGRPGLRLAAWRAVWGAQRSNPVYRARYQHLTSREQNKLRPAQAQTVAAAAILRHLYAVITTGQAWDPVIATHGKRRQVLPAAA